MHIKTLRQRHFISYLMFWSLITSWLPVTYYTLLTPTWDCPLLHTHTRKFNRLFIFKAMSKWLHHTKHFDVVALNWGHFFFLCKEPYTKYFKVCRPYSLSLLLQCKNHQRQHVNKWVWLCSDNVIYENHMAGRILPMGHNLLTPITLLGTKLLYKNH